MNPTNTQIARAENHWTRMANETVTVEEIGGTVYGFTTEVAARRLADRMNAGRVGYSENLETWFYVNK